MTRRLLAAADAIVMHCLPAHRGRETDAEVLESAPRAAHMEAT